MPNPEKVREIQFTIDQIVVLLKDLQKSPALSRLAASDIDVAVSRLQEISRELPTVSSKKGVVRLVLSSVSEAFRIYRKFNGS